MRCTWSLDGCCDLDVACRCRDHRGSLLCRIHDQYRTITAYQKQLVADNWAALCNDFGRLPGLGSLWKLHRSLGDKKRSRTLIVATLMLTRKNYSQTEETLLHSFFPRASLTPPQPLPNITIHDPVPEIESPFSFAQLTTVLRQGRPQSAPGHDGIQCIHLRNLPEPAQLHLLEQLNHSWETGLVPNHLKLSLIFPIPKPNKKQQTPDDFSHLRPISLTPVICKLT